MTKQDFLEGLRRYLSGSLDYRKVNEHLRYYTDYIDGQIRQGRSEEEVLEELGDPRLIAKTLSGMEEGEPVYDEYREEYIDDEEPRKAGGHYFNVNGKTIHMPGWVLSIIVGLLIFFVFSLVFTFLVGIVRYIPLIILGVFLYRLIRNYL